MKPPALRSPDRFVLAAAIILTVLVAGLSLAACFVPRGQMWGSDALLFLPVRLAFALVACALATGLAAAFVPLPDRVPLVVRNAGTALSLAAAAALFWLARVQHVLLGDGIAITSMLPETHELHPREPLASLAQQALWRHLGPLFAGNGRSREDVVGDCVAVGSVAAGVVFAAAALGIASELEKLFPSVEKRARAGTVALLALSLAAQGQSLVFFGYVENYAYPAACTALVLWAALRWWRGAASLFWVMAAFALACAFHLSNLVLGPALIVLLGASLATAQRRAASLRDLSIAAALAAAAILAAVRLGGFDLVRNVAELVASSRGGAKELFSVQHLRDFANEHVLLGPLGLLLLLPVGLRFAFDPRTSPGLRTFLVVLGASLAAASWLTPDMPLGYARDWDVFAALGVGLTVAALGSTLALVRTPRARQWTLACLLAASLLHTLPWVALNHSEAASLARFATLPLGLGRTESTLAWWHMKHKDYPQARRWIEAGLRANPDNIRAVDLYGRIALLEGKPEVAVSAYRAGVRMRPQRPEYRLQLAWALNAAGRPAEALAVLDTLERTHPRDATLWLERAVCLQSLRDQSGARAALSRSLALNPALEAYARQLLPDLMARP